MLMRRLDVETWVLDVARRVEEGALVEDGRVELKADWPDPAKAARRVAGHANAAFGDPILWIIGLDEVRGLTTALAKDLSEWVPAFRANFEGICPDIVDLVVPYRGASVTALQFDTERAPFVVKNPLYGSAPGGAISLEVPWRDATTVRSARREDLIRLLAQHVHVPELHVLRAALSAQKHEDARGDPNGPQWRISMTLYVIPFGRERVVMPIHLASLTVGAELASLSASDISFHVPDEIRSLRRAVFARDNDPPPRKDSVTLHATASELVADGPGSFIVTAYGPVEGDMLTQAQDVRLQFRAGLVGIDRPAFCSIQLTRQNSDERSVTFTLSVEV